MDGCVKLMLLGVVLAVISACGNKSNDKPSNGKLLIQFEHLINGQPVVKDQMIYTNAFGNQYEIAGLKYFISDVTLHRHDGSMVRIEKVKRVQYVDIDMPGTLSWQVADNIPASVYDSISFTFGLNEQLNQPNTYVNDPEKNMAWTVILGDGYHFMMMDGVFINLKGLPSPFGFHLGTGQIYTGGMASSNITGFVQNYFHVKVPASSFTVLNNKTTNVKLIMNIDSWFTTPTNWDFNKWSTMIMQNQEAMGTIKVNGRDAFSFESD